MYKLIINSTSVLRLSDNGIIPAVPANSDYAEYLRWLDKGNMPLPVDPPSVNEITATVIDAVQQRLDTFAQTHNYDGILSACTYAASGVPKFAAEGQYAVNARDATWATCYKIMTDVQAGTRPLPTLEQVLSELPELIWPD